jgi:hypothetical protein
VRSLIDHITLIPDGDQQRIEVRGELAAILRMAQGVGNATTTGGDADALAVQIKMVAGARNRRSHHSRVTIAIDHRPFRGWART